MDSLHQPLPLALLFIIPLLLLLGLLARSRWCSPFPPGQKASPHHWQHADDGPAHPQMPSQARLPIGGVFHLKMGFLRMVTISDPDAAHQVLQVHDNIFSNRPATIAISYLTYNHADMAFAHYGPFWRRR
ncbi:cytochrome P450 84A1-like [Neltuma alba]|uniref:cytochrome P450 84A1-like n=1 Tax=Neltuma alba TaxID=207710 RepID=UPI0010A438EA|nr:cytochrome P450 84A1-like [Prosopis alba]